MNIKPIRILAFAAIAALSQSAFAADGTISFTGTVTDSTCTVSGKNFSVALPTVSRTALAAAGDTAGATAFTITLSGCSPATGNVRTQFESGSSVDAATGRLLLQGTGVANNVQIQLKNADGSVIRVGAPVASQNSRPVALVSAGTPATGSATLSYAAEYYATGAAQAGSANSTVTYSIAYQ